MKDTLYEPGHRSSPQTQPQPHNMGPHHRHSSSLQNCQKKVLLFLSSSIYSILLQQYKQTKTLCIHIFFLINLYIYLKLALGSFCDLLFFKKSPKHFLKPKDFTASETDTGSGPPLYLPSSVT
jgi:hypothetical protein